MIVVGDCLQLYYGPSDPNPWTFVVVGFELRAGEPRVQLVRLDRDHAPRRRIQSHALEDIEGDLRAPRPSGAAWRKL